MSEMKCTLADAELLDAVQNWVSRLCETGGSAWALRVPVDLNHDPDMLITELCHRHVSLHARVARLEEALPDPDKLEILARWFDMRYQADVNPEVQTDLREWAKKIRCVLEEK